MLCRPGHIAFGSYESKRTPLLDKCREGVFVAMMKRKRKRADTNRERIRKLEVRVNRLEVALRVIRTWATFSWEGYPEGHLMEPAKVANLCEETLKG